MKNLKSERVFLWRVALDHLPDAPLRIERFSAAGPADAAELAEAMGFRADEVLERLAWSRCYLGRLEGTIGTYGWVSETDTKLGEIYSTFRPPPGEAYIWHCATQPPFQGRGLYTALLRYVTGYLMTAGLTAAWIATMADNQPGCRGVERAGFHRVLQIHYLQAGRWRTWRVRPLTPARDEVGAARWALLFGQPAKPVALV